MLTLLTNVAPILLGFIAKLFALKSQAASENQKLMIQSLQVRNDSINMARDRADKESPMAAWNRRFIIIVKGFSILGVKLTPDVVEYVTVEGMLKFDEIFQWATMIVEFYFGAQLAKGR